MEDGMMLITDPKLVAVVIDPTRRAILQLLVNGPKTSHSIGKVLGITQQLVNHHLLILRKHNLVTFKKVSDLAKSGRYGVFEYSSAAKSFRIQVQDLIPGPIPGKVQIRETQRHPKIKYDFGKVGI